MRTVVVADLLGNSDRQLGKLKVTPRSARWQSSILGEWLEAT